MGFSISPHTSQKAKSSRKAHSAPVNTYQSPSGYIFRLKIPTDTEIPGGCSGDTLKTVCHLLQATVKTDARISALCQQAPTQRGTRTPAPLCRTGRDKAQRTNHGDT